MNPKHKNGWSETTDAILDYITEGVFTVDRDLILTSMNKAAERITGIPREDAIGRPCFEVFRANICENNCTARETLDTKRSIMDRAVYIMTAQGKRIPVSVNTALLKDKRGSVPISANLFFAR